MWVTYHRYARRLQLNDLLDFASLNTEGFRKICKKFDKEHKDTTGQEMSERMMASCMAKEKVCASIL